MGPWTGGSSSSADLSQILMEVTQESETLAAEAQILRADTAQLMEAETLLQRELATARLGDERVRAMEERAQVAEARLQAAETRFREELLDERTTVTRLQAEIIYLERRGPRNSATASARPSESAIEACLRQLEEQLIERSRSRSHSQSVRHSSMNQTSVALRAAMPPPSPVDAPPPDAPVPDDAHTEGVGISVPTGTQGDDTLAS